MDKYRVIQAALRDLELGTTAKAVFGLLVDHRNAHSGQCNPSIVRLAALLGKSEDAISRAVKELESRGWIAARRVRGERTNYTIMFERAGRETGCTDATTPRVNAGGPDPAHEEGTRGNAGATPRNNAGRGTRENAALTKEENKRKEQGGDIPPTPRIEVFGPEEEPARTPVPEPVRSSRPQINVEAFDRDFQEWWAQYPKQEGQDGARREYRAARLRGATQADLLGGAKRYAAACQGKEPRFITMPVYWLRDGRWRDIPEPARSTHPGLEQRPSRHAERGFTPEGLERISAIVAASKAEQARERALNGGLPLPVSF
ncbi:helix-turn-helix domain-containing protein [Xanthobacter sp. DSM 14520]|uniref:helix-turn-helix domain-containing protein n=1 Tax=Xanthobacter autotrophicus (strain ATCC BAA-1158 / Py2) TaxID=78245 RepID=UPI00372C21F3